jgi:hypothetical protein
MTKFRIEGWAQSNNLRVSQGDRTVFVPGRGGRGDGPSELSVPTPGFAETRAAADVLADATVTPVYPLNAQGEYELEDRQFVVFDTRTDTREPANVSIDWGEDLGEYTHLPANFAHPDRRKRYMHVPLGHVFGRLCVHPEPGTGDYVFAPATADLELRDATHRVSLPPIRVKDPVATYGGAGGRTVYVGDPDRWGVNTHFPDVTSQAYLDAVAAFEAAARAGEVEGVSTAMARAAGAEFSLCLDDAIKTYKDDGSLRVRVLVQGGWRHVPSGDAIVDLALGRIEQLGTFGPGRMTIAAPPVGTPLNVSQGTIGTRYGGKVGRGEHTYFGIEFAGVHDPVWPSRPDMEAVLGLPEGTLTDRFAQVGFTQYLGSDGYMWRISVSDCRCSGLWSWLGGAGATVHTEDFTINYVNYGLRAESRHCLYNGVSSFQPEGTKLGHEWERDGQRIRSTGHGKNENDGNNPFYVKHTALRFAQPDNVTLHMCYLDHPRAGWSGSQPTIRGATEPAGGPTTVRAQQAYESGLAVKMAISRCHIRASSLALHIGYDNQENMLIPTTRIVGAMNVLELHSNAGTGMTSQHPGGVTFWNNLVIHHAQGTDRYSAIGGGGDEDGGGQRAWYPEGMSPADDYVSTIGATHIVLGRAETVKQEIPDGRYFQLTTQPGRIRNEKRLNLEQWTDDGHLFRAALRAGMIARGDDPDADATFANLRDKKNNPMPDVDRTLVWAQGTVDINGAEFVRFATAGSGVEGYEQKWDYYVLSLDLHLLYTEPRGKFLSDQVWFFGTDVTALTGEFFQPSLNLSTFAPEAPLPGQNASVWAPRGVEGMRRLAGQAGAVSAGSRVDFWDRMGVPFYRQPENVVLGWVDAAGNAVTPAAGQKFGGMFGAGDWNAGQDTDADFFWGLISGTAFPALEARHLHPFALIVPSGSADGLFDEMHPGHVVQAGDAIRAAGNIAYHPAERNPRDVFSDPVTVT